MRLSSFFVSACLAALTLGNGGAARANPKPAVIGTIAPHSSGIVLVTQDFTNDLPASMQDKAVECKTTTLIVDDKASFDVLVHYDQVVSHPQFFRRVELSLTAPLSSGVDVNVTFGSPTNRGTVENPLMTVPFLLQWSGEGWLRTDRWTLYPDGRLEKSP